MTRPIDAGFATLSAANETRMCRLLRVTRWTDGVVKYLTDAGTNIVYGGNTYLADPGFDCTSLTWSRDATSASIDIDIPIGIDTPILLQDVMDGLYAGAAAQMDVIDWSAPASGRLRNANFRFGDVRYDDSGKATLYLVGELDRALELVPKTVSPKCPYNLGDERCKVVLAGETSWNDVGLITAVASQSEFTLDASPARADGHYDLGSCKLGGDNTPFPPLQVRRYESDTILLWLPAPRTIEVGDSYQLYTGCDWTTGPMGCARYDNIVNFGGFPFKVMSSGGLTVPPAEPPPEEEEDEGFGKPMAAGGGGGSSTGIAW